jgi:hypothetical protein
VTYDYKNVMSENVAFTVDSICFSGYVLSKLLKYSKDILRECSSVVLCAYFVLCSEILHASDLVKYLVHAF